MKIALLYLCHIIHRDAWNKLGNLDKESSMTNYIEIVNKVDPNWQSSPVIERGKGSEEEVDRSTPIHSSCKEVQDVLYHN